MKTALKFVLPLAVAASPAAAQPATPVAPAAAAPAVSEPLARHTADRDSPLLDFEYSWPEAVSSEPKLVARLSDDLAKTYEQALENARENKADMAKVGGPFHQNMFTRSWSLKGETPRLVSLLSETNEFAGGAHPNHTSSALLWDRQADREVELGQLFDSPGAFEAAVRPEFCRLLDSERLKRREGEALEGFSECPAFSELTIVPSDASGSGDFDSIQLIADPYVAGPYAEGDYEIVVPASEALVDALAPEYRSDFEVQLPQ